MPPPIAAPVDTPYPGTIALTANLTNTLDRVVTVHETIPVKAGELVLLIRSGSREPIRRGGRLTQWRGCS